MILNDANLTPMQNGNKMTLKAFLESLTLCVEIPKILFDVLDLPDVTNSFLTIAAIVAIVSKG